MNENLKTTLKAWPVIACVTIGLCFLTKAVAGWIGIDLPDQQNVTVVRQWLVHAFDSTKNLLTCAFLLAQVLVLLPAVEEVVFRWLLFMLPSRLMRKSGVVSVVDAWHPAAVAFVVAAASSVLFSSAHYIAQPFPDAAFVALSFFGAAQCWLYAKTDRIWCPMLNHFLFNLTNLLLLFVVPE